jgi:hypothetical protein
MRRCVGLTIGFIACKKSNLKGWFCNLKPNNKLLEGDLSSPTVTKIWPQNKLGNCHINIYGS